MCTRRHRLRSINSNTQPPPLLLAVTMKAWRLRGTQQQRQQNAGVVAQWRCACLAFVGVAKALENLSISLCPRRLQKALYVQTVKPGLIHLRLSYSTIADSRPRRSCVRAVLQLNFRIFHENVSLKILNVCALTIIVTRFTF